MTLNNVGWIKVHRQIRDAKIWKDDEPFDMRSAWVDLIMMVNYEDQKFILDKKAITIKRGQTFTSIRKLSARWHWGVKRTMTYLSLLEDLEMVTVTTTARGTLLTIVNYDVYQGDGNTEGNSLDNAHDNAHDNSHDTQYKNIKNNKEKKNKCKISTFGNFNQRDTEEDDIYSILSKGKKGGNQ